MLGGVYSYSDGGRKMVLTCHTRHVRRVTTRRNRHHSGRFALSRHYSTMGPQGATGDLIIMKKIAAVAIIMLFVVGIVFAADTTFGAGKTRNITFNADLKVGDKVLPAGEYKVLHLMEGNEHTLVFKSLTNVEKVRVKCTMVQLDKKADMTFSEYNTVGGNRVLTTIVFRGDNFKHTF